jgi:hypothetical protein
MEYNTTRNSLTMPEYGRNIQKMIKYAISIEDRIKRNKLANVIVNIMSQRNPKMKDAGDFRQKLWDHLFIISEFKLDVDSPFPMPSKNVLFNKPQPVRYSNNNIKYRYYGKNIENIIDKAIQYEEGPEKEALIKTIANHIKKLYLTWNRESVNDDLIYNHLKELSKGKLILGENIRLNETSDILARTRKKKYNNKQRDNYTNGRTRGRKRDNYKSNGTS